MPVTSVLAFELLVLLLLLGFLALFVYTLLTGAPSVPTKRRAVAEVIALAGIKPGDRVVDLGSGDGRLVIAAARAGAEAHGYEINPLLVWYSRLRIVSAGLHGKAFVHLQSFWRVDLSGFEAFLLFGMPGIMPRLAAKLAAERPGGVVVSNIFLFPDWPPETQVGTVRRYRVPDERRAGR